MALLVNGVALALGLAALLPPPPLLAQVAGPFSTLEISGAAAANVNRERLHELWRPGHGALVRVSTPFYAGAVAISAQLAYFRSRGDGEPDFRAITRAAEWNALLPVARGIRSFAGVQVGAIDMKFLDPPRHTDNPEENELLLGGQAGISARLRGGLALTLMASHRRVFTSVPIDLTYTSVGVEYQVRAPTWLRAVLE